MKKKICLLGLLFVVFLLTGCTADYTLTLEDGVFSEHVVVNAEYVKNNPMISIRDLKKDDKILEISDNNYYNFDLKSNGNNDVLTLDYTYDKVSIEKSKIWNGCFSSKSFVDSDDYYYFKADGNSCEFLKSANLTLKTDNKVLMSNADKIDEKNGVYTWENYTGGEVMFQVSKSITAKKSIDAKNGKGFIPWYVKFIVIIGIVGAAGFYIVKVKENLK